MRPRGPSKPRFQSILDTGSRIRTRHLAAVGVPGNGLIGIATPRALGCHARRGRQKRRVREAIRDARIDTGSLDLVFLARAEIAELSYAELRKEVESLINQCLSRSTDKSASS